MIAGLLLWIAMHLGGGAVRPFSLPLDQAVTAVKAHVADPARQATALDILARMQQTDREWSAAREPQVKRLAALTADRASAPADFERLITDTRAQADAVQARFLALRFELKAQLTAAEWAAVFPMPAR